MSHDSNLLDIPRPALCGLLQPASGRRNYLSAHNLITILKLSRLNMDYNSNDLFPCDKKD
jgi:hypothetical protein